MTVRMLDYTRRHLRSAVGALLFLSLLGTMPLIREISADGGDDGSTVAATIRVRIQNLEVSLTTDGAANAGELFVIRIALINTGLTIIENVEATINLPKEGIGIIGRPTQSMGEISPGGQKEIEWKVFAEVPGSYIIQVTANGTGEDGGTPAPAEATIIVEVTRGFQAQGGSGGGGGRARISPEIEFRPESLTFTSVVGEGDPQPQIIGVSTARNRSVLRFTITADAPWLRANPIKGRSDATNDREPVTVSVLTSGLEPGTYEGFITISARSARNDPQAVPVTLIIEEASEPGMISRTRSSVRNGEESEIFTPDNQVQVIIPQGAVPDDGDGVVEVEIKSIDVSSVPDAPGGIVIVRVVELNTLVDGKVTPTEYGEPVKLVFVLTEADLARAEGDTSRLGVFLFNEETGEWETMAVSYEADPPPAGKLVAMLDHFSVYALWVMEEAMSEAQQATETETPTPTLVPTAAPTVTSLPSVVPTPTASAVATTTPVPATRTPFPTVVRKPTPTVAPFFLAFRITATPVPPGRLPAEFKAPPFAEETGSLGTTTWILIVVIIAVLAGIGVVTLASGSRAV